MATVKKVIDLAIEEIGYHEKVSGNNLDNKVAPNDGSGNYTKYARDLDKEPYFNGCKQGYDWCTTFFCWLHWIANGKDSKKTRASLYQPSDHSNNLGAGCVYAVNYYKGANQWFSVPKVGDQIFFNIDSNPDADHTGIVYQIDGNRVYTIEGNVSQQVQRRSYRKNDSCILGYGRPNYEAQETKPEPTETEVYDMPLIEEGDEGDAVKIWQVICGTEIDGEFGPNTRQATIRYQEENGLEVDGIVGPESWTYGLNHVE